MRLMLNFHSCITALSLAVAILGLEACKLHEPRDPSPAGVQAATLIWRIDLDSPDGPGQMLEAITPVFWEGHQTWRVTHYPLDPSTSTVNDFDLYDVDADSLRPVRNVMQTSKFRLEIHFKNDVATLRQVTEDRISDEQIPLATSVMPEGPGERVFVASLPLQTGFVREYYILDRWSGQGTSRLKQVQLSVVGAKQITTATGSKDVFELEIRASDDSFRIVQYVRRQPPYYPFRVEYIRGSKRLISEVALMILGQGGR
ncbi:MAG TPA: hypothetical protein VFD58_04205 [Blastocatellia bacterium]|nr:hypothetical protein [Blastocatellia bacterium]